MKTNIQAHLLVAVICAGGFLSLGKPAPVSAGRAEVETRQLATVVADGPGCRSADAARRASLIGEAEKLDLNSAGWHLRDLQAIKAAALLMFDQPDATCAEAATGTPR